MVTEDAILTKIVLVTLPALTVLIFQLKKTCRRLNLRMQMEYQWKLKLAQSEEDGIIGDFNWSSIEDAKAMVETELTSCSRYWEYSGIISS